MQAGEWAVQRTDELRLEKQTPSFASITPTLASVAAQITGVGMGKKENPSSAGTCMTTALGRRGIGDDDKGRVNRYTSCCPFSFMCCRIGVVTSFMLIQRSERRIEQRKLACIKYNPLSTAIKMLYYEGTHGASNNHCSSNRSDTV